MPLKILSLGWGMQSWTLAAMVALKELPPVDYAIHADTQHEHEATYAHAAKWKPWLEERGVSVVTVMATRIGVIREDWAGTGVMIPAFTVDKETGKRGAIRRQCTHDWKITPIRQYIRSLIPRPKPGDVESCQGISLDEWSRMRDSDVQYIINTYPLVDMRMTRADCEAWLRAHNLDVPVKSSCTFCPYTSLANWKALKRAGGPDWQEAIAVDESIRGRRPRHGPLYAHPARRPLPEAVSIPEDEGASQLEIAWEQPCDGGHCFV